MAQKRAFSSARRQKVTAAQYHMWRPYRAPERPLDCNAPFRRRRLGVS